MKIKYNDKLEYIINTINTNPNQIKFKELLSECIANNLYNELYINLPIIKILLEEHNNEINNVSTGII